MINTIWYLLIFFGIIYSLFSGNLQEINNAILKEAEAGVLFSINLIGIMSFWLGVMNIAEKSGILKKISRLFKIPIKMLFPGVPDNHPAQRWIIMNLISNMFGIGNGATAFGLKAMKELNSLNQNKKRASNAMCMFLVINMSSVQLVPLTVIKMRLDLGSKNPMEIIAPAFLATSVSLIVGIITVKLLEVKYRC